jgi:hypothetical protein
VVSGIWRRIRSLFAESDSIRDAPPPESPHPPDAARPLESTGQYLPDLPFRSPEQAPSPELIQPHPIPAPSSLGSTTLPSEPASAEPLPSVESLAERLSERLLEDESLRSGLTDDEYQPLLDWALERIGLVARHSAMLSPFAAVTSLSRAADQARELLRLIDLVLRDRETADPQLLRSRLEMLDTLLEPPLLDPERASTARARLEALLELPIEQLRRLPGRELVNRLLQLFA